MNLPWDVIWTGLSDVRLQPSIKAPGRLSPTLMKVNGIPCWANVQTWPSPHSGLYSHTCWKTWTLKPSFWEPGVSFLAEDNSEVGMVGRHSNQKAGHIPSRPTAASSSKRVRILDHTSWGHQGP